MTKLNDMQCVLLSHASQRENGFVLPPPDSLNTAPDRVTKTVASLLKLGLAVELETIVTAGTWREEGERRFAAIITEAGRAAIGVETLSTDDGEPGPGQRSTEVNPPTERTKTKSALVLELLRREGGASINNLIAATGWLPHTTRAALTGLRKKGHAIVRDRIDDVTCYAIKPVVPE